MGDSTPPNVTQTNTTKLSPEQQKLFDTAFPYAQQYAATPTTQYAGSGVAGFTPLEQQAQQQYVTGAAPTAGALATKSADAQSQMLDPNFQLDVANNPYLKAAMGGVTDQVTENLQDKILPGVRNGATMAGGMYSGASSKDAITTGQAIGDTNRGLSDSLSKMMLDAYTGGKSSLQTAIGQNPSVQSQQLIEPSILDAAGGQQRDMQQRLLDEQIQKYYTQQKLPLLQAQELMGMVQATPGGTGVGTATGAVPGANSTAQTAGTMAALLALLI